MSKTIIDAKHFALNGRESLEIVVRQSFVKCMHKAVPHNEPNPN